MSSSAAAARMEVRPPPPGAGLLGRVGRAISALSLGTLVTAGGQVVTVPVALLAWGDVRFGEWVLITGLVTFLRLTDLGLQTYVVNRFGASYARGDRGDVQRALHSTLRVQVPLVGVLLALVYLLTQLLPVQQLLGLRTVGGSALEFVLLLVAVELLIGVPMGVVVGIYRATGHLARAAMIGTVQQTAALALTLGLISVHASFVQVALARAAVPVVATVYILHDLHRLHPWLGVMPRTGSWREGLRMIGPGLFFLLIPLADYLSGQVVLLVLQQHLHGGEVTRFVTHRTVVNLAQMVSNLLIGAVWFELTALHARDEQDRLQRVQRGLVVFNVWLVGAALFGLLPFIGWIYPSWTAGKLALDWVTLGLLIARVVLWSVWNSSMTVLLATNRHRGATFALLGSAVVGCALGIVLVPVLGIRGGALAALAGDLLVAAWLIPRLSARETGGSAWRIAADAAGAFARGIGVPVLAAWGAWVLLPFTPVRYGVVLPLAVVLALWLMWTHFSTAERQKAKQLLNSRFSVP